MAADPKRDPDLEWLDYVRPVGLVVAPVLLKELGLAPMRQTQSDNAVVAAHVGDDSSKPGFNEPWALFEQVLGWKPQYVAGSPGGPGLPEKFYVPLPDHDTTLSPTWAVAELGGGGGEVQLLVRIEAPGIDPDARGVLEGWEATPHQRFERLLRETGVFAGLLVTEKKESRDDEDRYTPELRLVYAPSGETSGHLTFPLRPLATVPGRPMLGGLKLLLDSVRLFTDGDERRLPALLRKSREAQASVSTALAEQVLGALHELLRGFDAAEPKLIRELAQSRAGHLYEGLLTVLMRLVFVLYAEDRDLLPSRLDGRAREIYETSYSVRGLYARLVEDASLNPDTMDERRGGWGRLLSLFRLIHKGHPSHFVQARGGKLFDPDTFPFLEGRGDVAHASRVAALSDGCLLRVLDGLMTLQVKGGARERLSYRALDVEQIGSVYETVMGFTVECAMGRSLAIKAGKHNRTPVFVDLEKLAAAKGKERIKFLKEEADRAQLSASVAKAVETAKTAADLAVALDPIVDDRGSPKKHENVAGTPILQPTDERRRTGSHYTPRSLTEPVVRHALEPVFERLGPNATPEQILDLKVCDPAMGSGAFLVEACRALAARLVEAWSRYPAKKPVIPPDEDEELHARRLVAQRCLYGVDKNPLATDLAKLSLWLATLAGDHEFTFLDHALKSGDSLVGLSEAQIAGAHWDSSKPGLPLFRQLVKDRVAEAMKGRAEIQTAPDDTARAIQEQRHRSLEVRLREIRLMGDAVIAAFFAEDKPKAREKKRVEVESWLSASPVAWDRIATFAATLKQGVHPFTPFHWGIEYPEVFACEAKGFDAFIGNPPFLGGKKISGSFGDQYLSFLNSHFAGAGGQTDLVAYFFRRAAEVISRGTIGLLATKTIAKGDTRKSGLSLLCHRGWRIYVAERRIPWPGSAAVTVSALSLSKGLPVEKFLLDGEPVKQITAFLLHLGSSDDPVELADNAGLAYGGYKLDGLGFTFDDVQAAAEPISLMEALFAKDVRNKDLVFPLLGGDEILTNPDHRHRRFVIDFGEMTEDQARQWPDLMKVVEERVRPQRMRNSRERRRRLWWQFGEVSPGLRKACEKLDRFLVHPYTSTHTAFVLVNSSVRIAAPHVVICLDDFSSFAVLQSQVHDIWLRTTGGSREDRLVYLVSDCFRTFALPKHWTTIQHLGTAGEAYYHYRAGLMIGRQEGLTLTYNRFHDRTETADDVQRLRELHAAMDRAVLEAYGWCDLAAHAAPVFLDETNEDDHTYQERLFWPSDFRDEVLARLLALNAERHAEELRLGITPGMKGKAEDEDNENEAEDE